MCGRNGRVSAITQNMAVAAATIKAAATEVSGIVVLEVIMAVRNATMATMPVAVGAVAAWSKWKWSVV